ncbi:MAG TPA: hypothetical protein VFR47_26220 [Anaerolineales bacterium]|nr:hypothetical protein [Anaerolineales bacterium]
MANDDIAQKLALLPEGWAEENAESWQDAIQYYQRLVFDHPHSKFKYLLDLVQTISISDQVKLFRTYPSIWILIISTSSMKEEPRYGNLFIVVGVKDDNSAHVGYYGLTETLESIDCSNTKILPTLQPLLDRLWNETRGKKNA